MCRAHLSLPVVVLVFRSLKPPKSQMVARILRLLRKRDVAYYAVGIQNDTTRYVWVVVPLKFVQKTCWWCVFLFFLVVFFFRRVLGKNNRSLPCFLCASTHASQANEENLSHIPRFRRPLN